MTEKKIGSANHVNTTVYTNYILYCTLSITTLASMVALRTDFAISSAVYSTFPLILLSLRSVLGLVPT